MRTAVSSTSAIFGQDHPPPSKYDRKLLTALRLWAPGRISIGPTAFGRADEGV